MIIKTPTKYFLVSGNSEGFTPLNAFDGALIDAGVGNTNLVKMSSILPPACQKVPPIKLPFGALVPLAYASIKGEMPGEIISAAISVAIPVNDRTPGLIMEYSARGHRDDIEEIVRNMAAKGMEMRNEPVIEILSISAEHKIGHIGCAFAAVVLWE